MTKEKDVMLNEMKHPFRNAVMTRDIFVIRDRFFAVAQNDKRKRCHAE